MIKWISVEDALPEESKIFPWLVYTDQVDATKKYICRAWYIGIWVDAFGSYIEPLYYRPLPDPPRGRQ